MRLLEESFAGAQAVGDTLTAATVLSFLGDLDFFTGAYPQAAARYEESRRLVSALDDQGVSPGGCTGKPEPPSNSVPMNRQQARSPSPM